MPTSRGFIPVVVLFTAIFTSPVQARLNEQDLNRRPGHSYNVHTRNTAVVSPEELPSMHLLMKPLFTSTSSRPEPTAIHVTMNLTAPTKRFTPDQPLLTLPLKIVNVPTARYDEGSNPIVAHNAQGNPLRLSYRDVDPEVGPRMWYLDEGQPDSDTGVVLRFTAPYRITSKETQPGPRVELRRDVSGGGLVGQGTGFLPVPPPARGNGDEGNTFWGTEGGEGWNEAWNVNLEWDLSESPDGTHGAWSLGDEQTVTVSGTLDKLITNSIFAVGYLQRYPDWSVALPSSPSESNVYATYWLEPSPYNVTQLAQQTKEIYGRIATYFTSADPFRVFFRRIEETDGGSGATFSFLLEYSAHSAEYVSAIGMADLLAHEAVHEFALLDPLGSNPEFQDDEGVWYVEGGASWVGDLVGLNGADKVSRMGMVESLNNNAQAYYTSPVWTLEMDYGEVLRRYWDDYNIVRVSYYRGFMFFALLDGLVCRATDRKKSMDDVIVELYKLRRDGKPCTLHEVKDRVAELIGRKALDEAYTAFFRGELIVPPEESLERHGLKLVRQPWHRFELGIDTVSLRQLKVIGLVKGTNADKAGVRDGDVIVKGRMVWSVQDDLHGKMRLTVLRDGHELDFEWWPRTDEVVEAYGWVDIRGEQAPDEL